MKMQVIIAALGMSLGSAVAEAGESIAAAPEASLAMSDAGRGERIGLLSLHVGEIRTAELENWLEKAASTRFLDGHRYLVQLDGPITPARRAACERAGVELQEYLPHFAYVARLAGRTVADVAALDFVIWVGEWASEWKIADDFGTASFQNPEREQLAAAGWVTIRVTFFQGVGEDEARRVVAGVHEDAVVHGASTVAGNAIVAATLPTAAAIELVSEPLVQFLEEASETSFRSSGVRWLVQTSVPGGTPFYDRGLHGEDEVIGLLDGAVDSTHCSFYDTAPFGPSHRKILAYNGPLGSSPHGTHTAGVAAGDAGSLNDTRGVAYNSKLVLGPVPDYEEVSVYDSFAQHHAQGARIHSNSWGVTYISTYDGTCRGIDAFSFDYETSLVLFAASDLHIVTNPENAKNTLAVGASMAYPNEELHCTGGAGPTSDGRRKPDMLAPGCRTAAADSTTSCGTVASTGTSAATAALSGMAAIVRQYYTTGHYPTGAPRIDDRMVPSGALVKATLVNSGQDMSGPAGYPSNQEGWGRVDGDEACYFAGDDRRLVVLDDAFRNEGMETGDYRDYFVHVYDSSQSLRITLVWTDAPASAATGHGTAAVNDLDLAVYAPDGTGYIGNVFQNGQSVAGGWWDYDNNVEQVHLFVPAPGTYRVRVNAPAVNFGPQGYALVATGGVTLGGSWIDVCGTGATSSGCGPREEFLLVNGTTGGFDRTLFVDLNDPLEFDLAEASSEVNDGVDSPACIYLWMTEPIAIDVVQLPKRLGTMCFGPKFLASYAPSLTFNAIGRPNKLGQHDAPVPKPFLPDNGQFLPFYTLHQGLGYSATMTLQGLVPDRCSIGNVPYSVTNAVMVRVY